MKWTPVRQEQLPHQQEIQTHGDVTVVFSPSPYDIPEAFRTRTDTATGRFVIEFKYLADEALREEHPDRLIWLRVGERSSRIYAIEFDLAMLKREKIRLQAEGVQEAEEAIGDLEQRRPERRLSYRATTSLVRNLLRSPEFAGALP